MKIAIFVFILCCMPAVILILAALKMSGTRMQNQTETTDEALKRNTDFVDTEYQKYKENK